MLKEKAEATMAIPVDDPEGNAVVAIASSPASSSQDAVSPSSNDVPPFSLEKERYDQATYYGRFRKMVEVVDPRTLFYPQKDVDDAVNLLKDFQRQEEEKKIHGKTSGYRRFDDAELWHAKKVKDAIFHPDTNELLPKMCRMSGWLPFNAPVCVGALMATSTPSILFFHWVNQTQNSIINYSNRNATKPTDMSTVVKGYVGGVVGAIGIVFGLNKAIERSRSLSAVQKLKYKRFCGLPAVMTAAVINMICMRGNELTTGIDIYHEPEKSISSPSEPNEAFAPVVVGQSQFAAKKALTEMAISRMVLTVPVFLMAPIGMFLAEPIIKKNRRFLAIPFQSAFVLLGFGLGLPATIALFPQNGTVEASKLEPRFQNLRDQGGDLITVFRYNKGL